jgi:hypothetical protein
MTALDLSSLRFWEMFSEIGFVLVIVGVAGEVVELFERLVRKKSTRINLARVFWAIVVAGLGMEFLGSHNAMRIADAENARLHVVANLANERSESLSASNLVLQADVLKLQAKQKPRVITPTQVKDFIFLTERIPKVPVRVMTGNVNSEQFSFAQQIREMLNRAGFKTPDSDTNLAFQVYVDQRLVTYSFIGDTNEWQEIGLFIDTTNDPSNVSIPIQSIDGFTRPVVLGNDTNQIYSALMFVLKYGMGMKIGWKYAPDWVSPNHCGLYIVPKTY